MNAFAVLDPAYLTSLTEALYQTMATDACALEIVNRALAQARPTFP